MRKEGEWRKGEEVVGDESMKYTPTSAQKLLMAAGGKPLLRRAVSVNSLGSSQSLKTRDKLSV